jgi:hypothetical protein
MKDDRLNPFHGRWLCLWVFAACSLVPSVALPQSKLRVDADAVAIPEPLRDAWQNVLANADWSSRKTGSLGEDAAFSRFLPRSYEIQKMGSAVRIVTRWVTHGKCESTIRTPASLGVEKKKALEDALGQSISSLAESIDSSSSEQQRVTVLWCQFRLANRELIPFTELSDSDQQLLQPFADLAVSRLDTTVGPTSDCDSSRPSAGRSEQGSSGRRSRGAAAVPTPGGGVSGVIPTGLSGSVSGTVRNGDEDKDSKLQKYGVLIEEFRSRPGSLAFQKVREFTRCIRARTPEDALARAVAGHPGSIAGADGQRISFRVSLSGATCESRESRDGSSNEPGEKTDDDAGNLSPAPDPIGGVPEAGPDGELLVREREADPYSYDDVPFSGDYKDNTIAPDAPSPLIDDSDLPLPDEPPTDA